VEGWEGGDGVVWSDFLCICHGCESNLIFEEMVAL
jgi:hypothetical protein